MAMARSIGTSFWQSASNEPNCGTTGIEQGGFLRGLGVRAWDLWFVVWDIIRPSVYLLEFEKAGDE